MVRRIRMNPCYLNPSGFACVDDLLGSLGSIIFESGLPLTWTETDKILTKTRTNYNKNQLFIKYLVSKCLSYHISKRSATDNNHLTSVAPFVGLPVISNSSEVLVFVEHDTQGLGSSTAKFGHISQIDGS
jgi:hypothetical protein